MLQSAGVPLSKDRLFRTRGKNVTKFLSCLIVLLRVRNFRSVNEEDVRELLMSYPKQQTMETENQPFLIPMLIDRVR